MSDDGRIERLVDGVRRRLPSRSGNDRTVVSEGRAPGSGVEGDADRGVFLRRTGPEGDERTVPVEDAVAAALWRATDLEREAVPDVDGVVDEDLVALAEGERDEATVEVGGHRVTVREDGSVGVRTRSTVRRRAVLKVATAAGVTGGAGLGVGNFLGGSGSAPDAGVANRVDGDADADAESTPTFGYGGTPVDATTDASGDAVDEERSTDSPPSTDLVTATETVTATVTVTATRTETPANESTATATATETDEPARPPSAPPGGSTGGGDAGGSTGDSPDGGSADTATETATESEPTETDTYGVQGYGEYGYGGVR